jgi:hypothetical protein
VAVDGQHLYWTDSDSGSIGRADLDGSNPNPMFITPSGGANMLAVGG